MYLSSSHKMDYGCTSDIIIITAAWCGGALRSNGLSMFYECRGVCKVIGFLIWRAAAASQTSLSLHLRPSRDLISPFYTFVVRRCANVGT